MTEAKDFARMAVVWLAASTGFAAASAGARVFGHLPGCAAAGGFALLLLILAIRNFRTWLRLL